MIKPHLLVCKTFVYDLSISTIEFYTASNEIKFNIANLAKVSTNSSSETTNSHIVTTFNLFFVQSCSEVNMYFFCVFSQHPSTLTDFKRKQNKEKELTIKGSVCVCVDVLQLNLDIS